MVSESPSADSESCFTAFGVQFSRRGDGARPQHSTVRRQKSQEKGSGRESGQDHRKVKKVVDGSQIIASHLLELTSFGGDSLLPRKSNCAGLILKETSAWKRGCRDSIHKEKVQEKCRLQNYKCLLQFPAFGAHLILLRGDNLTFQHIAVAWSLIPGPWRDECFRSKKAEQWSQKCDNIDKSYYVKQKKVREPQCWET